MQLRGHREGTINLHANEGKKIETVLLNTMRGVVLNSCLLPKIESTISTLAWNNKSLLFQ
jgi:hypothetical protein